MKWSVFLVFFLAACQTRHDVSPRRDVVTPIDHGGILQLLEERRNSVVLINVWATWCTPCREELPALVKLYRDYHERGFSLVLISTDDVDLVDTKVRPMLREFGIDFPTYIHAGDDEAFITAMSPDWSGALPTSFLYDANGNLVNILVGQRSYAELEREIQKVISS